MAVRQTNGWGLLGSTRPRPGRHPGDQTPALEVRDLKVRASDGTVILDEISFSVEAGSVVAVVGPTGVGKTTLLNALTGRLTVETGSIRVNGDELVAGSEHIRRRLGYVPQEDALHPQLDLRRTLEYAALLRLPSSVDAIERTHRVHSVLEELGLEAQANLPVWSLSGGQRKRASVAVELLSHPEVLVLDEPTTGLDPGREKSVLAMLRTLADNGRTVLTVTHSPQALAACDRVLFLAPGGRVAFFGPPAAAVAYFGHADPADVFQALDRSPAEEWKRRFRCHPAHAKYVESDRSAPGGSGVSAPAMPRVSGQLRTLTRRYIDLIRSDRRHLMLLTLQGPLIGLLLWATLTPKSLAPLTGRISPGLLAEHRGDAVSVALFLSLAATWLGVANAVREIVKEHRTLLREEGVGLSLRAYVGAKALTLGVLTMVQAAVLTLIACTRQGVPAHGAVLGSALAEIMLASALAALAAVSLGLLLSALVTSPDKALTVLPMTLVAQLVFSGTWLPLDGPVIRQLRDVCSSHWAVHAMRATLDGNANEWWLSVVALVGLTAATLVATLAFVQRRVLPTRVGEIRARVASHFTPGLGRGIAAIAAVVLVLAVSEAAGSGSDYVSRPTGLAIGRRPPTLLQIVPPERALAPADLRQVAVPQVIPASIVTPVDPRQQQLAAAAAAADRAAATRPRSAPPSAPATTTPPTTVVPPVKPVPTTQPPLVSAQDVSATSAPANPLLNLVGSLLRVTLFPFRG